MKTLSLDELGRKSLQKLRHSNFRYTLLMATLNLSTNGPSITKSYQSVVNSGPPSGPAAKSLTYGQWALFVVTAPLVSSFQQDGGKESVMKVQSTGGEQREASVATSFILSEFRGRAC